MSYKEVQIAKEETHLTSFAYLNMRIFIVRSVVQTSKPYFKKISGILFINMFLFGIEITYKKIYVILAIKKSLSIIY